MEEKNKRHPLYKKFLNEWVESGALDIFEDWLIEQLSKAPETKTGEKVCPECNANVFIKQMNHCDGCGNEWSL